MGVSPEVSPFNQQRSNSQDGRQHSSYASGRIDSIGQNVNWRIFGQDAPWIFSEIICQVDADHTMHGSIRVSVDQTWQDDSGVLGNDHFNNLNIYAATAGVIDKNGKMEVTYNWKHDSPLKMEGELKPFITSVPRGTWPNPPSKPLVK